MWSHSGPNYAKEAGFTLVEMTAVLAIIAMASLAVVSYWVKNGREPSNEALARSTALLAYRASQTAVAHRRPVSINVNLQSGLISIKPGKKDEIVQFSVEGAGVQLVTGRTLVASSTIGEIVFLPDGSATGGEIRFQRKSQPAYRVSIHWLTGAISYGEVK